MGGGGIGKGGTADLNSLGVNPWPFVNQATQQSAQSTNNMYADLGLAGSSANQRDIQALGTRQAAFGNELALQDQSAQASELPGLIAQLTGNASTEGTAAGLAASGAGAGSVGGLGIG